MSYRRHSEYAPKVWHQNGPETRITVAKTKWMKEDGYNFHITSKSSCFVHYDIHWALHWRHNERDSVSNHQPYDCLLNCLFRRRSKKTSKLRVTGLCVGNSPGTAQMASYAENVSIWWRHHGPCETTPSQVGGWREVRRCRRKYMGVL